MFACCLVVNVYGPRCAELFPRLLAPGRALLIAVCVWPLATCTGYGAFALREVRWLV